VTMCSQL